MTSIPQDQSEHCAGCVFHPPNLPAEAYPVEDYAMLMRKRCSFDFRPGDEDCRQTRKTSCSLLDLEQTRRTP